MNERQSVARCPLALKPLATCLAAALAVGAIVAPSSARASTSSSVGGTRTLAPAPLAQTVSTPTGRPATVLQVTSCADDSGIGTLRSVVADALSGDTIDLTALSCSTITLLQGAIAINVDNLSLQGPGAARLTIDGANANRVIAHLGHGTLTISDISVANGRYEGQHYYAKGGCIYSVGSVAVTDAVVSHCNAGRTSHLGQGGGIYVAGDLTLAASAISDCAALGNYGVGGGALVYGGNLTISNSTISGNAAYGGGGFAIRYGSLSMYSSTISGNIASGTGGGAQVYAFTGNVFISDSTISDNYAGVFGGGLSEAGGFTLHNSTIAFNTGYYDAGGIFFENSYAYSQELQSSIVAKNAAIYASPFFAIDIGGNGGTIDGANNLIGSSDFIDPPDTLTGDPMLGPLHDNGGWTWTHALLPGSPAINAGNNVDDLEFDQRGAGLRRVFGAAADIGAFELNIVPASHWQERYGESVIPHSLSFALAPDQAGSNTLTIANTGTDTLVYSFTEAPTSEPSHLNLSANSGAAIGASYLQRGPNVLSSGAIARSRRVAPWAPRDITGDLLFVLDDGSYEDSISWTNNANSEETAALWLNRFTPPVDTGAFVIDSIAIVWPYSAQNSVIGKQVNLLAYYDADGDGDPTNAVRLGSDNFITITNLDTFVDYPVHFSVPGDGDIYVGFENTYALGGTSPILFPAALDQNSTSQGRSWVAGMSNGDADPNDIANNDEVGTIDSFGFPGNWLIRATGSTGGGNSGGCSNPADVPWLSEAPANGAVASHTSRIVTITADATGLGLGDYSALLCITTNDPDHSLIQIPVSLIVAK